MKVLDIFLHTWISRVSTRRSQAFKIDLVDFQRALLLLLRVRGRRAEQERDEEDEEEESSSRSHVVCFFFSRGCLSRIL